MFSRPQDIVALTCLQSYWAVSHNTKYVSEIDGDKNNCGGLPEEEKTPSKEKVGFEPTHGLSPVYPRSKGNS